MDVRVIRAEHLVRVPWKNGGGTTAEIAAFPEGSSFETFGWRISMADVESDGPFSPFPQIDRTLVVLQGNGIELDVNGVPYRLNRTSPKLSFSGNDTTACKLLSGPIRDLNVMTRRGYFEHRTRILGAGVMLLSEGTRAAFLVPMDSSFDVTLDGVIYSLQCFDTMRLGNTQELIQLSGSGRAILVEIA
ncbi:HutD family protein [Microvirga brassicacearum]|uniref:HutD family protein n=1 Tax=Microvirga brassicacearum TaxID=2580413 RepID=A0A5N3PD96_9HYPH|nr:HutD family protein [Microvirga brassicacearum]